VTGRANKPLAGNQAGLSRPASGSMRHRFTPGGACCRHNWRGSPRNEKGPVQGARDQGQYVWGTVPSAVVR
jgi:hypothetical protein